MKGTRRADTSGPQVISPPGDRFLFSGNRHETVPRALFLDRRLTPLERNAWQVIRLQLHHDGITAFPTYDQLAPYLASMPCVTRASSETVARALMLLRLTRWLSLVQRRRDHRTGRVLGNLYVLHDEPLTPFEAVQLDADYLDLVGRALTHASKAIQRIGYEALRELTTDPLLSGCVLPTRLQVIAQRLARQGWDIGNARNRMPSDEGYPQHESEDGDRPCLRKGEEPSSDSEVRPKPAPEAHLRNPNTDRTVRIKASSDTPTPVPRARDTLHLPPRFSMLRAEQQAGVLAALQHVDPALQQAVLDEWESRLASQAVRNPAGYLFGIVGKALRGEFHATSAPRHDTRAGPVPAPSPSTRAPTSPEAARGHLLQLRALLGIPPDTSG